MAVLLHSFAVARAWHHMLDLSWMSKAFTREDVDPPERTGRRRSASGLPPGAVNYITARGARRLETELRKLRNTADNGERVAELERILASVRVVDPPDGPSDSVAFGAAVTVKDIHGAIETYTVVGVEELGFAPDTVSWISPIGKTLLAAELGDRVTLENGRAAKVMKIDYRTD